MTDVELAWLAGYLEGEGCFYMAGAVLNHRNGRRHAGTPCIVVAATDEDVILKAARLLNSRSVKRIEPRAPGLKAQYRAHATGANAVDLMTRLLPLMGERRRIRIRQVLARTAARPGKCSGTRIWKSRLTEEQVLEVRAQYLLSHDRGASVQLAKQFGVSPLTIRRVVASQVYRHVAPKAVNG